MGVLCSCAVALETVDLIGGPCSTCRLGGWVEYKKFRTAPLCVVLETAESTWLSWVRYGNPAWFVKSESHICLSFNPVSTWGFLARMEN